MSNLYLNKATKITKIDIKLNRVNIYIDVNEYPQHLTTYYKNM